MLEDKDLKFASRSLENGVGASAGLGTVGGGASVVVNRKNSDRLTVTTEKAMVRLFSPSPAFTEVSGSNDASSLAASREAKVVD